MPRPLVFLAAALALSACSHSPLAPLPDPPTPVVTPSAPPVVTAPAKPLINIINAARIAPMATLDPTAAHRYFDTSGSYVFFASGNPANLAAVQQLKAAGWRFQLSKAYYSVASFQADVSAQTIEPGVVAVIYDNEDDLTPASETADGGFDIPTSRRTATRAFYALAKAHGLTVILAPGTVCNAGNVFPLLQTFTPGACYAYLHDIASYADIIDPQFQGLVASPSAHLTVTQESATLMRGVNPSIKILSQFTTSPIFHFTPDQNVAAMQAGLPYIDGIWANIDASPQGIADGMTALKGMNP